MIRESDRSSLPLLPQAFIDATLRRLQTPSDETRAQLAHGLLLAAGYLAASEATGGQSAQDAARAAPEAA